MPAPNIGEPLTRSQLERPVGEALEVLSVPTSPTAILTLRSFPRLRGLMADWNQVQHSIGDAGDLQDVLVRAYADTDLGPLRWNNKLRRLRFKDRSRLTSLSGIELFPHLHELLVSLAPLRDLTALHHASRDLSKLNIEACSIGDLEPIQSLEALRWLSASECGPVATVQPLSGLGELRVLWMFGTTRVLHDDLTPIAAIPALKGLRMKSRRPYRPSVPDIQSRLVEPTIPRPEEPTVTPSRDDGGAGGIGDRKRRQSGVPG
jgi:hypothetical protein